MTSSVPAPFPEPTQDERTMATLAHALQFVGSFIAPLVIFLIKRESRFVTFHALQAILLQLTFLIVAFGSMMVFFVAIMATLPAHGSNNPPFAVFFFPLIWLVLMGGHVTVLVLAIVYAVKAGKGEWAGYPIIGGLARRILGM